MRRFDLFRFAIKTLRTKYVMAFVSLVMIGVCCIYFAGAILLTVYTEKSEPCELTITTSDEYGFGEQAVQNILEIPDVLATTGVLEIPVTLTVGKYEASLKLVGVDAEYLQIEYSMGSVFPENSVMPWILLSKESQKTFRDPTDTTKRDSSYIPPVDWLNEEYSMSVGNNKYVSKLAGIFESEEPTVAGYIDLTVAKKILQEQGQPGAYSSLSVRIKNIGSAYSVTKQIEALGHFVSSSNSELQARWSALQREAAYLFLLGVVILVAALRQQAAETMKLKSDRKAQYVAMKWMGLTRQTMHRIKCVQSGCLCVVGVSLGMLIGYLIPKFIPVTQRAENVFCLGMPAVEGVVCWLICAAGILAISVWPSKNDRDF